MKTFHLFACGPTLEFAPSKPEYSIGVNDVAAYKRFVQNLVIVDPLEKFSPEKQNAIMNLTRKSIPVFSIVPEWERTFRVFTRFEFNRRRGDCASLNDPQRVPQSLCSPFAAACIAWSHLGARNVVMHGVDITTHAALSVNQATIFRHFVELASAFKRNGGTLYVGSKESPMSEHLPVYFGR